MISTDARMPLQYQAPFRVAAASPEHLDAKLGAAIADGIKHSHGGVLYGPTGVGKSYAMHVAMLGTVGRFDDAPLWVDWAEFIGDVHRFESLRADDRDRFDPVRRLFCWRGPLFVDDVGQDQLVDSGYRKGEAEALFDQFVNRRYGLDLPLWITTNLTPAEIRERYGERTFSRLFEHCLMIPVTGADRRLA